MRNFDGWFDEKEGFGHKFERFYDDLNAGDPQRIVEWLKAAYEEGYNQATYDVMKIYWDDGK